MAQQLSLTTSPQRESDFRFAKCLFDNIENLSPGELHFRRGHVLTVLSRALQPRGWWLCVSHVTGETGLAPVNRLRSVPSATSGQEHVISRSCNSCHQLSDVISRDEPMGDEERRRSWNAFSRMSDVTDGPEMNYDIPRQQSITSFPNNETDIEYDIPRSGEEVIGLSREMSTSSTLYDIPVNNRPISGPEVDYDQPREVTSGQTSEEEVLEEVLQQLMSKDLNELEFEKTISRIVFICDKMLKNSSNSPLIRGLHVSAQQLITTKATNQKTTQLVDDVTRLLHQLRVTPSAEPRPLPEVPSLLEEEEAEVQNEYAEPEDNYVLLRPEVNDDEESGSDPQFEALLRQHVLDTCDELLRACDECEQQLRRNHLLDVSKVVLVNWVKVVLISGFKLVYALKASARDASQVEERVQRLARETRGACLRERSFVSSVAVESVLQSVVQVKRTSLKSVL